MHTSGIENVSSFTLLSCSYVTTLLFARLLSIIYYPIGMELGLKTYFDDSETEMKKS